MQQVTINKLTGMISNNEFMDGIRTVSIIHNESNRLHFAVYFDDLIFMQGYESEVNLSKEGCTLDDWGVFRETLVNLEDVLVFIFTDHELTEAWKNSYLQGGITEDRWDRRTIFHPFNEVNELFCIDSITYYQIIGEERYESHTPNWKKGIVDWYKNKMIGGEIGC